MSRIISESWHPPLALGFCQWRASVEKSRELFVGKPLYPNGRIETYHEMDYDNNLMPVICGKCQEDAFQITFGDYSVIAECLECHHSAEIYSG